MSKKKIIRELLNVFRQGILTFCLIFALKSMLLEWICTLVILLQLFLLINYLPYVMRILNQLEQYSLLSCFFTIVYINYMNFNVDDNKGIIFKIFFYLSHLAFLLCFIYIFGIAFVVKNRRKVRQSLH